MAKPVEKVKCPKCHNKYKVKLQKGKPSRGCPYCDPAPETIATNQPTTLECQPTGA